MMKIRTPLGERQVRDDQLSSLGDYIKAIDCLGMTRWIMLESLREQEGKVIGRIIGGKEEIVLKKTTFLP